MALRLIRATLTEPNGTEYDLTDWMLDGSLSDIQQETEDDLLQITHSDVDVDLHDPWGDWFTLLSNAQRGELWDVRIERERADGTGAWDVVFAGVIDVPFSIRRDTTEHTVGIQVFSYSKILEWVSAETLVRMFTGRTATTSAANATCTFTAGNTTGLIVGDELTVDDGANRTTGTILRIDSSTVVTFTQNSAATVTAGVVTLDTPYYRNQSVATLAGLICTAAGFGVPVVDIAQELSSTPFPSSLATGGLPAAVPNAVLERLTALSVYASGNRYDATSVLSGFTSGGVDTVKNDWRPYSLTEPGTLRAASGTDEGNRAWDYAGGNYWELVTSGNNLNLHKNGAFVVTVATKNPADAAFSYSLDVDAVANEVWVGYWYQRFNAIPEFLGWTSAVRVYNSAGVFQRSPATPGGYIRAVRQLSAVMVLPANLYGVAFDEGHIRWNLAPVLYTTGTTTPLLTLTAVGANAEDTDDRLFTWTLRAMGSHLLCARKDAGSSYVAVWNSSTGELVGDYLHAPAVSARNLSTVFDAGATLTPYYVCFTGSAWAIYSTVFSGLIPYADFDGLSCAAAVRELALITGSHAFVDMTKTLFIVGRNSQTLRSMPVVELTEDPIDETVRPVSEWMRRGVELQGRTEAGTEVRVLVGNTGDSQLTLQVDLQLPVTEGLLSALGQAYLAALSPLGEQRDVLIEEPEGQPVEMLGLVRSPGGVLYRAMRLSNDLEDGTQELQLVQTIGQQ